MREFISEVEPFRDPSTPVRLDVGRPIGDNRLKGVRPDDTPRRLAPDADGTSVWLRRVRTAPVRPRDRRCPGLAIRRPPASRRGVPRGRGSQEYPDALMMAEFGGVDSVRDPRPLVALTMGDVAGVGPEVIARAWADEPLAGAGPSLRRRRLGHPPPGRRPARDRGRGPDHRRAGGGRADLGRHPLPRRHRARISPGSAQAWSTPGPAGPRATSWSRRSTWRWPGGSTRS